MSEARRLWIRFRSVEPEQRSEYREAVARAGVAAGDLGAHFWGFEMDAEVDDRAGTFVEFLEGPSDAVLARLDGAAGPALSAAGGTILREVLRGAEVLRCTEMREP